MKLRDAILAAPDLASERVEVPEWKLPDGSAVVLHVHEMNGHERAKWRKSLRDDKGEWIEDERYHLRLLVHTLKDEAGELVFTLDDLDALDRKREDVALRLFDVAQRLNHLKPEQAEAIEGK